jgi:hypothetical protein
LPRVQRAPFDRYSVTHAAVGAVFALSGVRPGWALASHIGFEAIEDPLKRATSSVWPDARPDGLANHAGDVASFAVGYSAARALRRVEGGPVLVALLVASGAGIWAWSLTSDQRFRRRGTGRAGSRPRPA